jgi:hypothetical protein
VPRSDCKVRSTGCEGFSRVMCVVDGDDVSIACSECAIGKGITPERAAEAAALNVQYDDVFVVGIAR